MIKLDVDPWCHQCWLFEPVLDNEPSVSFTNNNSNYIVSDITVRCENVDRCHFLKRIMEETGTRN